VVSLGLRWDYLSYNTQSLISPRFSAAYRLSDQTTLNGSYGFYEEAPSHIEGNTYLDPDLGNHRLGAQQSIALVIGVDQRIGEGILLRVEGYEKDFYQLIVSDPVLNYSNQGTGYARGVEFFLRRQPTDRFFGWVSYSLSDSQRQDGPGLPLHIYDFGEPNIFTLVAHYKLNPGWEVGLKWVYSTGLPYTPVTGAAVTTVGPHTYFVPSVGPVNSARLPDYERLDLSTSLTTLYDTWQWKVYLEIINALNNQDVLGYQYNLNYSQASVVNDLPFLPYIGFEAKY
jgi:outer membrane cobalamin receptor